MVWFFIFCVSVEFLFPRGGVGTRIQPSAERVELMEHVHNPCSLNVPKGTLNESPMKLQNDILKSIPQSLGQELGIYLISTSDKGIGMKSFSLFTISFLGSITVKMEF